MITVISAIAVLVKCAENVQKVLKHTKIMYICSNNVDNTLA